MKPGLSPSSTLHHLSSGVSNPQLAVLNYHGIESRQDEYLWLEEEKPYVLSSKFFEEQMDRLATTGFSTLTLKELGDWLNGKDFDLAPAVLTFDDGHLSHYEHVLTRLKQKKLKGVFFIPVSFVGQREQMTWSHLKDLLAEGFEIGSHGLRHIPLTDLEGDQVREELKRSKEILEDRLGVTVISFSVPRGFYQPRIAKIAAEVGYHFVFTSQFDLNQRKQNPLYLKRLAVKSELSIEKFSQMVKGELGAKRYSEQVKDMARRFVAPSVYDSMVGLIRTMKVGT